jgi:hypothetical protein
MGGSGQWIKSLMNLKKPDKDDHVSNCQPTMTISLVICVPLTINSQLLLNFVFHEKGIWCTREESKMEAVA